MKIKGFYGDVFDLLPKNKNGSVEVTKLDGRKVYLRMDDLKKVMEAWRLMVEVDQAVTALKKFKHINDSDLDEKEMSSLN